jgi:hypothetical protein
LHAPIRLSEEDGDATAERGHLIALSTREADDDTVAT